MRLEKLFTPIKIGAMEVKNRIVMPPMGTLYPTSDDIVNSRLKNYYRARAIGGAGLIVVEFSSVSKEGKPFPKMLGIYDDKFIPGLKELVDVIHEHGAKASIQLAHAGRQTNSAYIGTQPVAPSPIPDPTRNELPRELTGSEIKSIIKVFIVAARRAKEAGFDAVELHGAHGYLISQFISPYTNKRNDEYGGNVEGRTRFPAEIIKGIKRESGQDFPVVIRMNGNEYVKGGITPKDSKIIASFFEKAGADAIHISVGTGGCTPPLISVAPMAVNPGYLVPLAEEIKGSVKIPVIVPGRINDPIIADKVIKEGKADLISMGRALLADPELPNKAARKKFKEIRKCIACNQGCIDRLFALKDIRCLANPELGREEEWEIIPALNPKKIMVIGGGPGGLEAARVAALRGHDVYLYEEKKEWGGQFLLASIPPNKQDIKGLIDYFTYQIQKLKVHAYLGTKATAELANEIKPEAIVIATGASTIVPSLPGIEDNKRVVKAIDVLGGEIEVGDKVLVIGGGMVGAETANFLGNQGKKVIIAEMDKKIVPDMGPTTKYFLREDLKRHGVEILLSTRVKEVIDGTVVLEKNGSREILKDLDNIIIAVGSVPNQRIYNELKGKTPQIYLIGDAKEPRYALDAIHEGSKVAREI